ncbi:MAG: M1 family metallopeptidase [Culicoidibacterales bacterium]
MKKILITIAIAILLTACTPKIQNTGGKSLTTTLADESKSATAQITYKIDASLDVTSHIPVVRGNQVTSFSNNSDKKMETIVFHLYADSYNTDLTMPGLITFPKFPNDSYQQADYYGGVEIGTVKIGGEPVVFTQKNQVLEIKEFGGLKPNKAIGIEIEFTVSLPYSTERLGFYDNIYSITQWYPLLSKFDSTTESWDKKPYYQVGETDLVDASEYDVTFKLPEKFKAVTSGNITEIDETTIKSTLKAGRNFVLIASPRYTVYEQESGGVLFRSAYINDLHGEEDGGIKPVEAAKVAFAFYKQNIGPYPYNTFSIAETGVEGFAMEYSGLIQMGVYQDRQGRFSLPTEVIAHEAAHQWWYSAVGSDSFNEPYIDEGLTSFTTAWMLESTYQKPYKYKKSPATFSRIDRSVDKYSENQLEYYTVAYDGPTLLLFELQNLVGPQIFTKIIKDFYDQNKTKFGSKLKLLQLIEQHAGKDISQKFEQLLAKDDYKYGELTK